MDQCDQLLQPLFTGAKSLHSFIDLNLVFSNFCIQISFRFMHKSAMMHPFQRAFQGERDQDSDGDSEKLQQNVLHRMDGMRWVNFHHPVLGSQESDWSSKNNINFVR